VFCCFSLFFLLDDEEEKSSLAKKRQWREDFCKLSDSDKQPFVVSAIRMRTTLRAEMYTTLGFRNASVDRVSGNSVPL
jgi:hypothetical protein